MVMAVEVDVSPSDVVSSDEVLSSNEVVLSEEEEFVADEDSSVLAHESIRPKANAKIVENRRYFSFFIEPKLCAGYIIIWSN